MIKVSILLLSSCSLLAFDYVDFDSSMQSTKHASMLTQYNNQACFDFFKHIYIKNQQMPRTKIYRKYIPTIMHHVWFGNPLSDQYKKWRQSWIDMHPDWTFILWSDRALNDHEAVVASSFIELDELLKQGIAKRIIVLTHHLDFDNRAHFDQARNYGERSDILKWEIVYRYGGVYVDTDFQCYKSIEPLHYIFDFYTCLQPLDTGLVQLGAALFAAHPYHPILERCVKAMQFSAGPIVVRTGPIHFTNACIATIMNSKGYNIVLPSSYFYPCGYEEQELSETIWRRDESYAVHHWAGSWLKPEAFVQ